MSIEALYKDAVLAAAAYANWDESRTSITSALIEGGLSEAQIDSLFFGTNPVLRVGLS